MASSQCKAARSPATSALLCALLSMTWLPLCSSTWAQDSADVRLSRYTTGSTQPDASQLDPLEAMVQVSLPRTSVATVGEAVNYLLLRTGYRLADPPEAASPPTPVLSMPLPEVHRQLGTYSVRTALSVLVGAPFALSVDPAQRLVSFRTAPSEVRDATSAAARRRDSEHANRISTGSTR
jgi:conjugative transfer region protein (TIGR03748 family)